MDGVSQDTAIVIDEDETANGNGISVPAFSFRRPQKTVSIVLQTERFQVHRELLRDSAYLSAMLTENAQEVKLDAAAGTFGMYVEVLYKSQVITEFKLRHDTMDGGVPICDRVRLYKLADELKSVRIAEIAKESILTPLSYHSTKWWETCDLNKATDFLKILQHAYRLCTDWSLPEVIRDAIVGASGNCTEPVFSKMVLVLEQDFLRDVSRKLMKRTRKAERRAASTT